MLGCSCVVHLLQSPAMNNNNGQDAESKTRADSLLNDVMDGHNIGMAKMGRLTRAEQTTRRLLDSIAKLPDKARQAAEPLKIKLDSLQKDLSYAEFAMNKWMDEFNVDSAVNNVNDRIKLPGGRKIESNKSERSDPWAACKKRIP